MAGGAAVEAQERPRTLAAASLEHWPLEPLTIALLAVSAAVYFTGVGRLWRRAGTGQGIRMWQAAAFAGGLLTLGIALLSPLAWLSGILFSAHMTQHEMLMLVSAPLLVFAQPILAALWAAPRRWRESWSNWTGRPGTVTAWRHLTSPLAVFLIHGLALWIWHAPVLFEAALDHEGIHALQHLSFTLTAALFWWGMVHGRYGRIAYGAAVVYVFLTAVHSSVLGALLTVAPSVWIPSYAGAAASWPVNPLEDQQLAGLLMWIPSGVILIVFGLALFAAWLGESDRRAALGAIAASRQSARRG
jgi:cytochrome c oxidase assembly factor CtaG